MNHQQKVPKGGDSKPDAESRKQDDKDIAAIKKKRKKLPETPANEAASSKKMSPTRSHPESPTKAPSSPPEGSSHASVPLKKKKKVCSNAVRR